MVKKVMKWILIGIAALIGLVIVGVTLLVAISNYKGSNYWKFAKPQGMIETKYTSMGEHEVSLAEFDAPDTVWEKYEIWYPSNLEQSDQAYPVVVIANGTGMRASKQSAIYEHLASWGFIVAGNEDEHSRTGASSAATLDFILSLNEDPQSVFYGRIDTENIGIVGHSQGGVGAINAVTQQKNGNLYKTICAQSTTSSAVAYALNQLDDELGGGWSCDTSTLSIPAFMVAGTGSADAGNVEENRKNVLQKAVRKAFPPEFINRIDELVFFNSLQKEDMEKIIDIQMKGLRSRIAEAGYRLNVTPAAKKFVAEAGYDPYFGARPMKRAIQKYIEDPVSEFIIGLMQHPSSDSSFPDIPIITVGLAPDKKSTEVRIKHAELCLMQP